MSKPSSYVRVKIKEGDIELEVETDKESVDSVVEKIVRRLETRRKIKKDKGSSCRSLLEVLWKESFFAQDRNLREVIAELSRRGFNFNRTRVSHSLADLFEDGILSRHGKLGNLSYVQRIPP